VIQVSLGSVLGSGEIVSLSLGITIGLMLGCSKLCLGGLYGCLGGREYDWLS
jgi:hypothetical protein